MRKIEREEKRLDIEEKRVSDFTTSSFHPGMYKPRIIPNSENAGAGLAGEPSRPNSSSSSTSTSTSSDRTTSFNVVGLTGRLAATPTARHPASTRFLPCHYFDYCGGTSTGG
jgi:hypothetical protein